MDWDIIVFGGGSSEDMYFGAGNCILSLVPWCTLFKCLETSGWGHWVHNWYYPFYIFAVIYGGGVILMNFCGLNDIILVPFIFCS